MNKCLLNLLRNYEKWENELWYYLINTNENCNVKN